MKIQMLTSVITPNIHYVGGDTYEVGKLISEDLADKFVKKNYARKIEEETEEIEEVPERKKSKKKVVKNIEG